MRTIIKSVNGSEKSVKNSFRKGKNSWDLSGGRSFASQIKIAGYVIAAISTQISALVDKIFHPDIPYFDFEHLIVGGVSSTGIALATYFFSRIIKNKESQRQYVQHSLDTLLKATSPKVGHEFLDTLTEQMSKLFNTRYAFISEVDDNNVVHTVSVIRDGTHQENFTFELKNTPCESTVEKGVQFIERNAKNIFPKDKWLHDEGIESYFAVPIFDTSGKRFGHMGVMDSDALERNGYLESLLETFAKSAGNEMVRMKAEKALAESEEKFRTLIEQAGDSLILISPAGKLLDVNNQTCESLGYTREELLQMNVWDFESTYTQETFEKAHKLVNLSKKVTFEGIHRRKDGSTFPVEVRVGSIKFKDKIYDLALARDISERKKAENELIESKRKYENLVETSQDMIFQCDMKGRFTFLNNAWEETTGYPLGDMIGKQFTEFKNPDVAAQDMKTFENLLKNGKLKGYETKYIAKSGEERILIFNAQILKDEAGEVIGTQGTAYDITERKKAEKKLQESEERFRRAFDDATIGMAMLDLKGKYIKSNRTFSKMLGYTEKQLLARTFRDISHPGDLKFGDDSLKSMISGTADSVRYEKRYIHKSGKTIWVSLLSTLLRDRENKPLHFITQILDITERKKAEFELRESEEQIRNFSQQMEQLSLSVADMISTENEQEIFDRISKSIVKYSDYRRVIISYFVDKPPYREIIGYSGVGKKVIDRLSKLEMPKSRYMVVDQGIKVGQSSYYVPHTMKNILHKEAVEFGIGPVADQGESWHPEDNLFVTMNDREGNLIGVISVDESKSGKKPTAETVRPLEIFSSVIAQVIIQKKSEQKLKQLEEQLYQSQKMESIGRLAGGIAHDFNNILTSISGGAQILQLQINEDTPAGKAADLILRGVERASNLTKQMLGFARGGRYNPIPIDMNDLIKDTVDMSGKIFKRNTKIVYSLMQNLNAAEADKNQIEQVVTNLIINANDAMPEGGVLTLKTENVEFSEKLFDEKQFTISPGSYVKVSVTDTGTGMDKETITKIFDPFFTTKSKDKGTGLGLATVYGIIKNHKGEIEVISKPGEGSTFDFYLPVSDKAIVKPDKKKENIKKGKATILVVDDEEQIRTISKLLLEQIGYKVLIAEDGVEALKIYKKNNGKIDLVLLDMLMPNMAGKETFRKMKKIDDKLKVIIISGFSKDSNARELLREGALKYIQKPYNMTLLSETIAWALAEN